MTYLFPKTSHLEDSDTRVGRSLDHLTAVAKKGNSKLGELDSPRGVAIDSKSNHIYIAAGLNNTSRVSIFSETGDFVKSFSHIHMRRPYGIAIHQEHVYLTDTKANSILHFKVAPEIEIVGKQGGRGSGFGDFDEPRQLAVSINGEVFVADRNNHRIQILDSDLFYQRHISHHSLKRPCDVQLTPNEVYTLSDINSPCIHLFTKAGEIIRSLITSGYDLGMQVNHPSFFCLDSDGNLFISDRIADQIKIFSKDGALLQTIGERGHEVGMFKYPCGIALINLKLVVVSLNPKCGLQIFSW